MKYKLKLMKNKSRGQSLLTSKNVDYEDKLVKNVFLIEFVIDTYECDTLHIMPSCSWTSEEALELLQELIRFKFGRTWTFLQKRENKQHLIWFGNESTGTDNLPVYCQSVCELTSHDWALTLPDNDSQVALA